MGCRPPSSFSAKNGYSRTAEAAKGELENVSQRSVTCFEKTRRGEWIFSSSFGAQVG